ncbi:hypothetical protein WH47_01082 [Habropoda laboriosa]|uniref:Uncharacterized protein n=1 Tax=Habropoda laboriosa TaxID=597456 RepID=A0A0L7R0X2_9HYME|nr:hypothetical protein WH47_01082 [Habropoda laboriosa]
MPRLVRDSDEEEDVKHGRKTRALTEAASVDSPLRRSSRIKPAIRENESSPESLLSDASNVSNTQTTRVRTRQKLAMDGSSTENQRTLRSRINSVSSDVSEVAETDVGTLSKRTARTNFNDALNKTNNRRSKRFTRAGSEANSPPPATRFTRSTRASSVGPETDTRKNESTCTPVKIRKRTSVLPSEVTVIEEKIPVVAIDRTLPNVNIVNKIDLKDSHKASVKESDNLLIENMGTTMNEEDPDSSDNMQKLALSTETESVNESIHSESSKKNVSLKVRRNSSLNNSIEDVESVKDENEVESNHSTEINTKLCEQSEKIHNKENKDISIKMDVSIEKVNMDEIKESESDKSNTSENIHESNEISKKANTSGSVLENNEMNEKANISENVNETNEMSEKANISENVTETNEMSEKANTSGSVLENNEMNEKANISKNVTETNEMSKNANTSENVTETNEMKEINEVTDKLNTSENVHKKNEMSSINALSSPNLNNVKLSKSSDKILITDISHSKHEDTHDLKDNNGMNNSSTGNISESLDACMNLGDSTVINVNEDNVINAVKNSQSFIVTETSVEFSQEIPESEKQSKKVSVLDNSLTLKNQRIHKLSERKSKTNEEKNKNNQENMEIDNDSDTNVTNLFQDIPADEWKQQKNADTDKNSVHSVSTERLENESEGEYDLVLVDTEAWLTAESAKTKKKKQISDCDSDDTVVLETETDSMKAVNEENMAMDISESKCKLNVSKGKSPNTKGRKSMDPKVIKNKENVIEDLEDIKDVKDTAQDAEIQSVRDKSLSKSHKTIEMEENTSNKSNSSEDVPRKRRSLNKSKQDIKNMSDSDNSENKFTIFRKLFFNAESDTNSDDILSFSNTNEETKIVTKKRKLSNALPSENEETKTLKKKKKLLNTLPSENEETKILKKKKKLTNVSANEEENVKPLKKKKKVSAVLSNENEGTKILKKKNKVSNALLSENEETKTLKKKKKLLNAASNENGGTKALKKKKKLLNASSSENDETKVLKKKKKLLNVSPSENEETRILKKKEKLTNVSTNEEENVKPVKKKKKGSAVLSNENEETKILKQKKKVPNTSPNENEEPKILKKKKKLSNAIANEEEDIKLVKKKKKDLSNESGETKILKKKKKVPNALSSENENTKTTKKTKEVSDGLPNKNLSKKKKKLLSEDSTLQDEDVAFSEARNEALGMLKSTLDTIKANKEMKKKKQKEHMERMQRQKEIKIKRLKSKNQTAETNKIEPQKSNIKRLSEEDLERLSDISRLPKKKRSSKKEDQLLSSRSMINSGVKDTKNVYLEEDSTPLSSCISTTEFSVVSLETIKKKKKVPEITSFRQKMLARNKREPVTAYLMYLEKQKASGKAKFCNKSQ